MIEAEQLKYKLNSFQEPLEDLSGSLALEAKKECVPDSLLLPESVVIEILHHLKLTLLRHDPVPPVRPLPAPSQYLSS